MIEMIKGLFYFFPRREGSLKHQILILSWGVIVEAMYYYLEALSWDYVDWTNPESLTNSEHGNLLVNSFPRTHWSLIGNLVQCRYWIEAQVKRMNLVKEERSSLVRGRSKEDNGEEWRENRFREAFALEKKRSRAEGRSWERKLRTGRNWRES